MRSTTVTDALKESQHDPAKEARRARDLAQRALIREDWGAAAFHRDAAIDWEATYYAARDAGLRLIGESAGER